MTALQKQPSKRLPSFFGYPFPTLFEDIEKEFLNMFNKTPFLDRVERSTYPKVDIVEEADQVTIEASIPGLSRSDVSISYESEILKISGQSRNSKEEKTEKNYIYRELHKSSFSRSFSLPETEFNIDSISASADNGVLKIVVPRKVSLDSKTEVKQIEIK